MCGIKDYISRSSASNWILFVLKLSIVSLTVLQECNDKVVTEYGVTPAIITLNFHFRGTLNASTGWREIVYLKF